MLKKLKFKAIIVSILFLIACAAFAFLAVNTNSPDNSQSSTSIPNSENHIHHFGEWYKATESFDEENELMGRACECGITENCEICPDGCVIKVLFVDSTAIDGGDGSLSKPFNSITQARNTIRKLKKNSFDGITVYVSSGEYSTEGLEFGEEDSGSTSCPIKYKSISGKATINGGASIRADSFVPAEKHPEAYQRLPQSVRDKVVVADISSDEYNLDEEDYGRINAIGTYTTSDRYQNGLSGEMYGELFVDGERQILARYPNKDYIPTGSPIIEGIHSESKEENGDPMGDVFKIDSDLATRIDSWESIDNVWAFGFWKYDWADSSSLIKSVDIQNKELELMYQSFFGIKEGAPYYIYNCLEELDSAGEYYIDRENGLLYYYPEKPLEDSDLVISLASDPIIEINSNNISFENFTITGARGNGIVINGSNVKIEGCNVTGIGGTAIIANGQDIKIISNTISNIGMDGIAISGGDRNSLTPSNNIVCNNLIHDWAQVYKTYRAGISLYGVGNICSHNELYNSPHLAITYSGNNNIVEYNNIHNVCLETDDAGAIYAGRSWSSYGNHVRYNLIYGIGANGHTPDGIYMDDAISGQYVYGNILVDIPKFSIHIGGGRDMVVYGNLIIDSGNSSIRYDARAREGVLKETWFSEHVVQNKGDLWLDLYHSPWQSESWQNSYPQYRYMTDDFSQIDSPNFIPNPAGSYVSKNIIYSTHGNIGNIDDDVYEFSNVNDNILSLSFIFEAQYGHTNEDDYAENFGRIISQNVDEFRDINFAEIGLK